MSDEFKPRLVHLPGTRLTPQVVLHRTLNKIAKIKSVTVVIQWDDDTFDVDWSEQRMSELCMSALSLHGLATKIASGESGA